VSDPITHESSFEDWPQAALAPKRSLRKNARADRQVNVFLNFFASRISRVMIVCWKAASRFPVLHKSARFFCDAQEVRSARFVDYGATLLRCTAMG
jgi:hypothetical protein